LIDVQLAELLCRFKTERDINEVVANVKAPLLVSSNDITGLVG
jgi:hypothetical protein